MSEFIELPIILYDHDFEQKTGRNADECPLIEVSKFIDLNRMESYSESVPFSDFREDNKIWTEVRMVSGDSFIVNMPVAEFLKLIKQ